LNTMGAADAVAFGVPNIANLTLANASLQRLY
jgi:hypothetical protein